jgi:tripartite-type tricarboxylate transporter receptor subunit TctC
VLAACVASSQVGPAQAQDAGAFLKGQTVRFIVGYSPGGGYDTYARMLQPHYGRHIPGNPRIIVKSVPGAGTLVAANYLYEIAQGDGTEIGTVGSGTATAELLETPSIRFDPRKFVWLGSMTSDVSVALAWHTTGITSIKDTFARKMIVGGGGPTSGNVIFPLLLNRLLGTKFEIITGYKSSGEAMLAVERGELDGIISWNYSSIRASRLYLVTDKKINLLLQFALSKHEELPDVPVVTELARNDEERAILELIFARQEMGRPFLAPPSTPPAVATILRDAFDATMRDPEFLADAAKRKIEINRPMSGAEIDAMIARFYAYPRSVVQKAIALTDTTTIKESAPK